MKNDTITKHNPVSMQKPTEMCLHYHNQGCQIEHVTGYFDYSMWNTLLYTIFGI